MPHPPMDDSYYMPRTWNDLSLEQLDGSGKVAWAATGFGASPIESQLKDGTVIYSKNTAENVPNPNYIENPPPNTPYQPREIPTGKIFVGTITPDGKKNEKAFTVEGTIQRIMTNEETGSFFVCHGENKASEYSSSGELISRTTIPQVDVKLYPEGLSGQKSVILRDGERKKAYSFDVESGKLTKLTETDMDYSYKVLIKEMENQEDTPDAPAAQTMEEDDRYIYIDGIKMDKK